MNFVAFSTVITELWKADETDGVVNTTSLKAQIQRFAPRFMGYSQQDAQVNKFQYIIYLKKRLVIHYTISCARNS